MGHHRLLLTIPEAAEALGVSRATLYRLLASGRLRATRIGRRCTRVAISELERFVAECTPRALDAKDDHTPSS